MKKSLTFLFIQMLLVCQSVFAQDTLDSIAKVQSITQFDEIELRILLSGVDFSNPGSDAIEKFEAHQSYSPRLVELAESGNAAAQNLLGYCYLEADGVKKDPDKAFFWLSKAAEQDNLKALNSLGYCYEKGIGVDPDPFQAYSFYKKAALRGMPKAFINVAQCYLKGVGTKEDLLKARAWFEKGAECGYRVAQTNVGYLYLAIDGQENYDKAFHWLTKASEQGSPNAMEMLGMCYEKGWGTEVNMQKANEWYSKSFKLGNEHAKELIKE